MSSSLMMRYRGQCKKLSEALVAEHPGWRLVRGYYHCPLWGKQFHWWVVDSDGHIHDPSVLQFPSGGLGEYEEFDGQVECAECDFCETRKHCTLVQPRICEVGLTRKHLKNSYRRAGVAREFLSGRKLREEEVTIDGRYAFCSDECFGRFVGLL